MTTLLEASLDRPRPRRVRRLPVSYEQRGLWFIHQTNPDCGAYHLVFSAEVEATPALAERAAAILAALTAEHEALRVSFAATGSGPELWVWDNVAPVLHVTDARTLAADSLRERIRADTRRPFDLAEPPLWRVQVYRVGGSRWIVVCVAHHIALDFWSLGLLLQSAVDRLGGGSDTLSADGSAFADYADEQAARIGLGETRSEWLGYWQQQLAGAPATLNLPLDRPRPALMTYHGRSLPFQLSAAASDAIRRLAQQSGATPFMCLLAAYQVLLSRFSGEHDVLVGSPVAGRLRRRYRHALGNFVNTVVLRSRIDPERSFLDLLEQVRTTVVDALRNQDCPFPWLVEELAPRRDPSYSPIYQVGFAWERLPLMREFADFFIPEPPPVERTIGDLKLRPYSLPQQEGQLDLAVEMGGERDGAYCGVFKFNTDLFEPASVRDMAESFVALVEAIVDSPDCPLQDLPSVTPAQQAALLARGRGPAMALPEIGVFELFAAQAERTPANCAVSDPTTAWSYAELIRAAETFAARLQQMGVRPGDRVGLMLDRGVVMLAAALGIMRTGAAYVPLDPSYPADRLAYVAAEAGLKALLTQSSLQPRWPAGVPVCRADDTPPPGLSLRPVAPDPEACAYILYTSGSTGKPKGVRVPHRAVVNFLLAAQQELRLDEGARMLTVSSIAFDLSVLELYLPLTVGGRVLIWDRDTAADPRALGARIAETDANWMQATPTTWQMLLSAGWPGKKDLNVVTGGEVLPPALAEALVAVTANLWTIYGPTETTVWCTCDLIRSGDRIGLGHPIANTRLYVLDDRQRLVPPGAVGEVYIGGACVALDYWRRPDLTAAQFLPGLPFDPAGGRVYRSGDRARWTADGRLEFHGRVDHQIKLRGYRIELGEIESVLRRQAGVDDVVVLVREDRRGEPRLVAYLVIPPGAEPTPASLRAALKETLPAYMVPSAFVLLDAFPKTPNNKIDRKALPAPDDQLADGHFVPPRDGIEIRLARIWGEVLGLPRVGIHDNFFELGGHSLLAVQLMTAIRREWGCDLPISELLLHSTIAELAPRLRDDAQVARQSPVVPLRQGESRLAPLFLFHPIGGNVFCYVEMVRHLTPGRPVIALQAPGLEEAGEADVTIESIACRYLPEIRRLQPRGPYLFGGWCFGGVIAFEAALQLRAAGEEMGGIILMDTRAPIPENVPSDGDDATLLSWFARDLAIPFGKTLHIAPETLRDLPADAMFDHVLDAARGIGVVPDDADRSQMQRYFEVYIANGIALQTYFPDPAGVDVLLLRARDETADYGPALGWDRLVEGRLAMSDVPGDHSTMMYAPNAAEIAKAIDAQLPPVSIS